MSQKVLIVDDEPLARLRIKNYLVKNHPELRLEEAYDGFVALRRIAEFMPDIVFLDIEMPEINGFDLLHHLERRNFKVIFQTAFNEFAVQAFEENACDYILKPFSDERLEKALAKALAGPPAADSLKGLDNHLIKENVFLERIIVNVGSRHKVIEQDEINYFLSEEHVTRVFLNGIDYAYDYSLSFLEERLNPNKFVRVHRNAIVNVAEIAVFSVGAKGTVTLKSGQVLPVSREKKKKLKELMEAK